jgi:hypothetical protein
MSKKLKTGKFDKFHVLYTTLPGSIICSAGISLGKSKTRMLATFNALKNLKDFQLSIDNITAWLETQWPDFKAEDFYKHAVLVSDKDGILTPLVTNWMFTSTDPNEPACINILPLSPDGTQTGILNYCDNELFTDRIVYDFLDEVEDDVEEE